MSIEETPDLLTYLGGGRQALARAHEEFGRALSAEEYWWLGVGLAATTLAELNEKPYAAGRLEQLLDKLGQENAGEDWLQQLVEELAGLDAEGLLWPVYERAGGDGPVCSTGLEIWSGFHAEAGYFLALAHIGVALAVAREDAAAVAALAAAIADMVESGLSQAQEETILEAFRLVASPPGDLGVDQEEPEA